MADPQSPPLNPDGSYVPATWAEGGAAAEPTAGRKDTGFLPGGVDTPPADDWNWAHQTALRYARTIQGRVILSSDGLSSSWMPPGLTGQWSTNGVGALQGFLSDDPAGVNSLVASAFLDPDADGTGVRIQIRVAKASPHTFPATRDTFVYVPTSTVVGGIAEEPELTYLDVAIGNPAPAAPAGTVLVWRVETDGVTIVDQEIVLPRFPAFQAIGVVNLFAASLQISGDADIGGDMSVNGNSILGDSVTDTVACSGDLNVVRDLTVLGSTACGDAGGDTHLFTGLVTANTGVRVAGGDLQADNNVTLGDAAGDAVTVNGTTQHNAPVTFAAGAAVANTQTLSLTGTASILGGAGSSITLGAGSFIDTTDADGIVRAGELALYSDATPSTTTGVVQFHGRWLTVGLNSLARKISVPVEDNVAGIISTGAAQVDTGAQVVLTLGIGDVVQIEMDMEMTNTSAANNINVIIDVNGVIVGGSEARRAVAAGIYISVRRVVKYTVAADNVYTFKARYGASAGTTSARNIRILVRHSNA